MEIIDSHCHYWEPDLPNRPWDPQGAILGPPLSCENLLALAAEAGVTKIVQVTPSIMGYDNAYSLECAERYPDKIAGVFVRLDPVGDDMPARLAEYRRHPKFWGVRITLHQGGNESWLDKGTLD